MPMTSTKLHARRHRKTCSCTFSTHHIFGTVQDIMKQMLLQLLEKRWGCNFYVAVKHSLQLQLQSFTLKQLFSEESCSVVGLSEKMSFQLRSELSATVERWAKVRWKCVPDDRSRDGETSLADGRVCPQNEQVATTSRTEWPTWRFRNRTDGLLEVDRTGTSDTVEGQSSKFFAN